MLVSIRAYNYGIIFAKLLTYYSLNYAGILGASLVTYKSITAVVDELLVITRTLMFDWISNL